MRPKVILRSAFLGWLRGVWVNAFAPERKPLKKRYPRATCTTCGKRIAVTGDDKLWRHKCVGG